MLTVRPRLEANMTTGAFGLVAGSMLRLLRRNISSGAASSFTCGGHSPWRTYAYLEGFPDSRIRQLKSAQQDTASFAACNELHLTTDYGKDTVTVTCNLVCN
jgi:hypothetical protein